MRLLSTITLKLKEFIGTEKPRYAILSHTWGKGEILYLDITGSTDWRQKKGAFKVLKSCKIAKAKGYEYIWIDTCCINKDSSAELSEAINSMFKWYQESEVCLAYLIDVFGPDRNSSGARAGWTLQELVAPSDVEFYDEDWTCFGTKSRLSAEIAGETGIAEIVLRHRHRRGVRSVLRTFSTASIMSWAWRRETTRPEDIAYCLLGLFDVNLPLLYGEGEEKAFSRLQKEIIQTSNDQSILAWRGLHDGRSGYFPGLAESIDFFADGNSILLDRTAGHTGAITQPDPQAQLPSMAVIGNEVKAPMLLINLQRERDSPHPAPHAVLAVLDCSIASKPLARLAIKLHRYDSHSSKYYRASPKLYTIDPDFPHNETEWEPERRLERWPFMIRPRLGSDYTIDPNKAQTAIVTIELARKVPLRTELLPPLRAYEIIDPDAEKCTVKRIAPDLTDYQLQDFKVGGMGFVFLYKPYYATCVLAWRALCTSRDEHDLEDTSQISQAYDYVCVLLRQQEMDKLLFLESMNEFSTAELFSAENYRIDDLLSDNKLWHKQSSLVLPGHPMRKITATMTSQSFLERTIPKLTVTVTPVETKDLEQQSNLLDRITWDVSRLRLTAD
ncbi:heterokaryon incompatibility protein-domain-containing protein [Xylariomycetidae sp. FL0641]|nr:heterokaryon incompatibility protein-domain-containing protein [Xylariomycetidae sp. FL0641]